MEIVLVVTAAVFIALGHELSTRLWPPSTAALQPFERLAATAFLAMAVWLASDWVLALVHALTRETLIARTALGLVVTLVLAFRRGGWTIRNPRLDRRTIAILGLALLPLLIWLEVTLWRGWVLPPLSHDAVSYHLPKAVLYARAGGFDPLTALHPTARKLPANYEMLLADVMLTTGSDRITEWISTFLFVLFVVISVALAQRWWGRHAFADATLALITAATPVLLLHGAAHKNDLLAGVAMASALLWGGRFTARRERASLVLLILSLAVAIGTKPQGGFLALAFVPVVLWTLRREMRFKLVVKLALASIVALALLGGAVYAANFWTERSFPGHQASTKAVTTIAYGEWRNLIEAPYVLLAAPWMLSSHKLYVPWESTPWFWRRHEIYFSHLGVVFSLATLVLIVAAAAHRWAPVFTRQGLAERNWVTYASVATFAAMVPVVSVPHGLFTISLPRYVLFLVPVVFGWTLAPLLRAISGRAAIAALFGASAMFTIEAAGYTTNDAFAPMRFVLWASQNAGTRVIPFEPNRAALIADRVAGPREKIAIYAGFASWLLPVFGADLQRPVQLIPWDARRLDVDQDVQWVVIDRGYESVWQNPEFRDLSQAGDFMLRGRISREETAFIQAAVTDPRFRVFFWNRHRHQIILQALRGSGGSLPAANGRGERSSPPRS